MPSIIRSAPTPAAGEHANLPDSEWADRGGSGASINLDVKNADALFAQAIEAGATVVMPRCDQFWGDRYGQVIDPFGHTWAIATHVENVTSRQMPSGPRCSSLRWPNPRPARPAPRTARRGRGRTETGTTARPRDPLGP